MVEPWNKTQAGICRCLQALAEALKINASVSNVDLGCNKIGEEGVEAWWVPLNAATCHDVMSPTYPDIL